VPDTGYHFTDWSDGITTTRRTDENVTDDVTVTANFTINTYTLTYTAGAHGTISGTSSQTVNYGGEGTVVTAVPDTGYHFTDWSDGVLTADRIDENISEDVEVTANFAINTYTLIYSAGAHGSITGTTPQTVNYGEAGTEVTAVPDEGYYFEDWSDDSTQNPRIDENVTSDLEVIANFLDYTVISDIRVRNIAPETSTIVWTTNHPATSLVRYGLTSDYGNEESSTELVSRHSVTLTGLTPGTVYHYSVTSTGNTETTSTDATFSTKIPAPTIVFPATNTAIPTQKPTITGLSLSQSRVTIVIDGQELATVTTTIGRGGTGDFHYHVSTPLTYGWHILVARAVNQDGFSSADSQSVRFMVDPPFITPTLEPPIVLDEKNPTIRIIGLAAENSIIHVYLDDAEVEKFTLGTHPSGTASFWRDIDSFSAGEHTIFLQAENQKGKLSNPTPTYSFKIVQSWQRQLLQPSATSRYIVQVGDNLWKISRLLYGSGSLWKKILAVNTIINATTKLLQPGWILNIP